MLLVTFHGGKPSSNVPNPVHNVYAYKDSGGDPVETKVLHGADSYLKDAELRGLAWAYNHLYVANGRKDTNTVLRFKGSGTKYDFTNVFASREGGSGQSGIDSIFHPYALTFDNAQYCYVSSQDTDVVSRLVISDSTGKTGSAAPIPSGLPAGGTFFSGTFVACSQGKLPGLSATTPVATPQGLEVEIENGKVQHSVRDVLLTGGLLYVCDEAASLVKAYDVNGNCKLVSNSVPSPAHLLLNHGQLYVSGGDAVMSAPLNSSSIKFTAVADVDGKGASGMAFNAKGDKFFVADRKKNEVHSYDVSSTGIFSNKKKIIKDMPDNPEFIYYVSG
ncbi:MAG TPA: hypothetical protein VHA33_24215 [Candidatus Angelobacter sp.]|jgi:hypothetical protein|nr:hypothetical protein [Candidatus Angelobacter sp.]